MKRIFTFSLILAACGPSQPREKPEPIYFLSPDRRFDAVEVYPKAPPAEPEKFEPDDGLTLADKFEGVIDIESIMTRGVDLYLVKKELHNLHRVVVFTTCLGERLREPSDGAIVERHIRRNSRDARACAKKIQQMTAEEISASAVKAIEDSERSQ